MYLVSSPEESSVAAEEESVSVTGTKDSSERRSRCAFDNDVTFAAGPCVVKTKKYIKKTISADADEYY